VGAVRTPHRSITAFVPGAIPFCLLDDDLSFLSGSDRQLRGGLRLGTFGAATWPSPGRWRICGPVKLFPREKGYERTLWDVACSSIRDLFLGRET